ncbi:MAG: S8 family serine peptidase [Elusimicrobia bacterium]|nr:S8 family serine peptidase [Elusimicrobiota bacterium]
MRQNSTRQEKMKTFSVLSVFLFAAIAEIQAMPAFETVWGNTNLETIKLLRMTGIINPQDWDALSDDERRILLAAFDDEGNLTSYGRKLLEELIASRLGNPHANPNPNPNNQPSVTADLGRRLSRMQAAFAKGVPGHTGLWRTAERAFMGRVQSGPLVEAGMHNWSRPVRLSSAWPAADNEQESESPKMVRILVTPAQAVQQSRYHINKETSYASAAQTALAEVGIDQALLAQSNARLVHTLKVFNLVVIEAPEDKIQQLALALEAQGNYSKPVTQFHMSSPPMSRPLHNFPKPAFSLSPRGRGRSSTQSRALDTGQGEGVIKTQSEFSAARTMSAPASLAGRSALGFLSRLGAPLTKTAQTATQSDDGFSPLLADSVPMIEPNKFYEAGIHGENAALLVIDSGLDASHLDFAGRNMHQRDFSSDADNADYIGHGTHVTSIAVGSGEASSGTYRGVAYGTQEIYMAKIFGNSPESVTDDMILAGLDWGVTEADGKKLVINMSLGGPGDPDDVLSRAVNQLAHQGHAVIVAAGNSGPGDDTMKSPGIARDALTVGAVDKNGLITNYSSRGAIGGYATPSRPGVFYNKPDLVAPGGGVQLSPLGNLLSMSGNLNNRFDLMGMGSGNEGFCRYSPGIIGAHSSAMPSTACDVMVNGQPLYTKMSGTSMATPHVAGANLLVMDYLERNGGVNENSFLQSKAAQMEAARPIYDANGNLYKPSEQGAGMLDLNRLYDLITSRLNLGLPIGNISAEIAIWVASNVGQQRTIEENSSYRVTRFGIINTQTGDVVNSDEELAHLTQSSAPIVPAALPVSRTGGVGQSHAVDMGQSVANQKLPRYLY